MASSASAYLDQYIKTAAGDNVRINWSLLDQRSYMRCKKCSAVLFFETWVSGETIRQEVQDWVKSHKHDEEQRSQERELKKKLADFANNAMRANGNVQDLARSIETLQNMANPVPKTPTVKEQKWWRIR